VSYSNSEKALKSFIATRGKTTSSMDTTRLIKTIYNHSVRVLILRSTSIGSFCAGADLFERRTMSQAQVAKFLDDLRDALGKLEALPMPTIAAIDGPALGGGLELSLACDLRVASESVYVKNLTFPLHLFFPI
jgi:enoyl-CoA hydratase/carnithine racemase